jgi:nucleotide-binding universal stress UspA family protein
MTQPFSAGRPGSENLFLGPRIEHILENAPCPVVVFNAY